MTEMRCPLCSWSSVVVESKDVVIIKSPWDEGGDVITIKDHREEPSADEYREAIDLARQEYPNAMFGDCSEAAGHWAARIVKLEKVGSSRMYKEKI